MKIISVMTYDHTVRSEIVTWTIEDSDLYVDGKPVGFTPDVRLGYEPRCVLQLLHKGWRLLGPPIHYEGDDDVPGSWDWWLEKI